MYDHYIAVDWAQSNMAISRMTGKSKDIKKDYGHDFRSWESSCLFKNSER